MLNSLEFPVAVVAHDAGAANHIIAWLKTVDRARILVHMAGPALALWHQEFPGSPVRALSAAVSRSRTLISGTGWSSCVEHEARRLAKARAIRSIAVVDHWVNYRERFVRDCKQILPDEIWVTDDFAEELVRSEFREIPVVQMPNLYLRTLVEEVRQLEQEQMRCTGVNLLYVSEPIRKAWGPNVTDGEFKALDYFLENLPLLALGSSVTIKLRPHPSDPVGKYDKWLEAHRDLRVILDASKTLTEAIAWSDVVVGCQSYAMVAALASGKRVISSIPHWAPPCVLPHPAIRKLSEFTR